MFKVLGLAAATVLIAASPAMAQAPTSNAYGGAGGVLNEVVTGTAAPAGTPGAGETAPGAANNTAAGAPNGVAGETASGEPGTAGSVPRSEVKGERSSGVAGATFVADTGTPGAGSLPFTGLDVGLLALGSLLLVALGLGLRRLGGRPGAAV